MWIHSIQSAMISLITLKLVNVEHYQRPAYREYTVAACTSSQRPSSSSINCIRSVWGRALFGISLNRNFSILSFWYHVTVPPAKLVQCLIILDESPCVSWLRNIESSPYEMLHTASLVLKHYLTSCCTTYLSSYHLYKACVSSIKERIAFGNTNSQWISWTWFVAVIVSRNQPLASVMTFLTCWHVSRSLLHGNSFFIQHFRASWTITMGSICTNLTHHSGSHIFRSEFEAI